ncbi:1,4-alpha-glucan branching protein [Streptomyces hygroscopicus]|uniref:maltokinase N-terminal cap-like domain-containing protein n=1 Tax=Streptomyces hygroscopicus TaxID=1912 RepID=UPI00224045C8|nr:1,4-alpha-glucan branching protein [Streptomyces hygroscopicus]MCW7940802.1 1,4-alpha-glucan branching protein [Streptomyces hygroscopicus]
MAIIHHTTLTPGKLELLASWLPGQPWYKGTGRKPSLSKSGGFRLDDPRGEVGIEFMVTTDDSGDRPVSYHVPLSYRGAPLEGAEEALLGTSEHGVLGRRWIYDGTHDPVLVAQLLALLQGRAEPQAQSINDTPDPSVTVHFTGTGVASEVLSTTVGNGPDDTRLTVETTAAGAIRQLTVEVARVLQPAGSPPADAAGHVTAGWRFPEGQENRGVFAVLHAATP